MRWIARRINVRRICSRPAARISCCAPTSMPSAESGGRPSCSGDDEGRVAQRSGRKYLQPRHAAEHSHESDRWDGGAVDGVNCTARPDWDIVAIRVGRDGHLERSGRVAGRQARRLRRLWRGRRLFDLDRARGRRCTIRLTPIGATENAPDWSPDGQSNRLLHQERGVVGLATIRVGTGDQPRVLAHAYRGSASRMVAAW